MKTKVFSLFVISFLGLSLNQYSDNDNCNTFYPLVKGYKWVYNEYNKKDKLENISTTLVEDVIYTNEAIEYVLHVKSESAKPKKDEQPFEKTLSYFCENGMLRIDMSSFVPDSYKDMDVTIEQKELTIPSTLKSGQKLEDGQVIVYLNGSALMQVDIFDRIVEKMETITTKAGEFNCVVISQKTKTKIAFMTMEGSGKQWISPKAGEVKSESFDKNGKKISSRELIEFSTGN